MSLTVNMKLEDLFYFLGVRYNTQATPHVSWLLGHIVWFSVCDKKGLLEPNFSQIFCKVFTTLFPNLAPGVDEKERRQISHPQ